MSSIIFVVRRLNTSIKSVCCSKKAVDKGDSQIEGVNIHCVKGVSDTNFAKDYT